MEILILFNTVSNSGLSRISPSDGGVGSLSVLLRVFLSSRRSVVVINVYFKRLLFFYKNHAYVNFFPTFVAFK